VLMVALPPTSTNTVIEHRYCCTGAFIARSGNRKDTDTLVGFIHKPIVQCQINYCLRENQAWGTD